MMPYYRWIKVLSIKQLYTRKLIEGTKRIELREILAFVLELLFK